MFDDAGPALGEKRFSALVAAYGSRPERWPPEERDAALNFARTDAGQRILAKAAPLDALLSRSAAPRPTAALAGRILEAGGRRAKLHRAVLRWLLGAGLIGVGIAGGLTGAVAVSLTLPSATSSFSDTETAFGNVLGDGDINSEIQ